MSQAINYNHFVYDLDSVVALTQQINEKIGFWWHYDNPGSLLMYSDLQVRLGEIFDLINDFEDNLIPFKQSIKDKFLSGTDSKTWDRTANYLIITFHKNFADIFSDTYKSYIRCESMCHERFDMNGVLNRQIQLDQLSDENKLLFHNRNVLNTVKTAVRSWGAAIRDSIEVFTPDIFLTNKHILNNALPLSIKKGYFPNPDGSTPVSPNQESGLMNKDQPPQQESSLLTILDTSASVCSMRLMGLFTVCDDTIKTRAEGKTSDFYFSQSLFNEIETTVGIIADVSWGAMQENTLQHEMRKTLLSFQRDRHDELYYMLIRNVLTNLNKCIIEVEKYLANQKIYDDFIKICHWSMTEEDEKIALHALSKLHPAVYSSNLLNSAKYLRIAIKSIIPPSDFDRVLPLDELPTIPNPINQEPEPKETEKSVLKNLPPKVLLLDRLGFFRLPEVLKLSYESKGRLVSALCGGSADNAVDYIRQCDPDRLSLEKNPYRNPANIRVVQELINSLNGG